MMTSQPPGPSSLSLDKEDGLDHEHLFRTWKARLFIVERGRFRHSLGVQTSMNSYFSGSSDIDGLVLLVGRRMDPRDGYMLLPELSGLKMGSDRILVLFGFLSKLES